MLVLTLDIDSQRDSNGCDPTSPNYYSLSKLWITVCEGYGDGV